MSYKSFPRDYGEDTEQTCTNHPVLNFVKNKGLERQYHTLFDWERRNANKFFSLFGSDFRDFMSAVIREEPGIDAAIRAFLELGETRNQLVHQNFANFPLEKTADEIYELYKTAVVFVDEIPIKLREFVNQRLNQ
ncbi:MAG: hypothetical protein EI684_18570 [Candidatus Viridilinea halotolerans]|uniref:RiboL-PSP-HEPN domain-containing protein n=1 Tax=Candidatus Viridilinea halotolerans TaxID=2491704 RepID=A0A426TTC2_9CHLR|nr:MAG: hypothetical protein EI684_18570 [Candidatus Viridilinea halotolerans]